MIHAEGEFQASQRLRDAADVISGNPASLQLRYLQTLTEIGASQNSTVVFPLPLDVVKPFVDAQAAMRPPEQAAHDAGNGQLSRASNGREPVGLERDDLELLVPDPHPALAAGLPAAAAGDRLVGGAGTVAHVRAVRRLSSNPRRPRAGGNGVAGRAVDPLRRRCPPRASGSNA